MVLEYKRKFFYRLTLLTVCISYGHGIVWVLKTTPVIFGDPVVLQCNVGNNCRPYTTRRWSGGSLQTIISVNNVSSNITKYRMMEHKDSYDFDLMIYDFSVSDAGCKYSCYCGFDQHSQKLKLSETDYICLPKKDHIKVNKSSDTVIIRFESVYPKPRCSAFFQNENISRFMQSTGNRSSMLYDVELRINVGKVIDDQNCNGHLKVNCLFGTRNMTVLHGYKVETCSGYDQSVATLFAILSSTLFSVCLWFSVVVTFYLRNRLCVNNHNRKKENPEQVPMIPKTQFETFNSNEQVQKTAGAKVANDSDNFTDSTCIKMDSLLANAVCKEKYRTGSDVKNILQVNENWKDNTVHQFDQILREIEYPDYEFQREHGSSTDETKGRKENTLASTQADSLLEFGDLSDIPFLKRNLEDTDIEDAYFNNSSFPLTQQDEKEEFVYNTSSSDIQIKQNENISKMSNCVSDANLLIDDQILHKDKNRNMKETVVVNIQKDSDVTSHMKTTGVAVDSNPLNCKLSDNIKLPDCEAADGPRISELSKEMTSSDAISYQQTSSPDVFNNMKINNVDNDRSEVSYSIFETASIETDNQQEETGQSKSMDVNSKEVHSTDVVNHPSNSEVTSHMKTTGVAVDSSPVNSKLSDNIKVPVCEAADGPGISEFSEDITNSDVISNEQTSSTEVFNNMKTINVDDYDSSDVSLSIFAPVCVETDNQQEETGQSKSMEVAGKEAHSYQSNSKISYTVEACRDMSDCRQSILKVLPTTQSSRRHPQRFCITGLHKNCFWNRRGTSNRVKDYCRGKHNKEYNFPRS